MSAAREAAPVALSASAVVPKGLEIHSRKSDVLRLECAALNRYLTGTPPDSYVLGKYLDAHKQLHALEDREGDAVDRVILRVARRGGLFTEIADSYARLFRKGGPLRSKLIVLLSILESAPRAHRHLNESVTGAWLAVVLSLCAWGVRGVACAVAGVLLFGPLHAAAAISARVSSRPRREKAEL